MLYHNCATLCALFVFRFANIPFTSMLLAVFRACMPCRCSTSWAMAPNRWYDFDSNQYHPTRLLYFKKRAHNWAHICTSLVVFWSIRRKEIKTIDITSVVKVPDTITEGKKSFNRRESGRKLSNAFIFKSSGLITFPFMKIDYYLSWRGSIYFQN